MGTLKTLLSKFIAVSALASCTITTKYVIEVNLPAYEPLKLQLQEAAEDFYSGNLKQAKKELETIVYAVSFLNPELCENKIVRDIVIPSHEFLGRTYIYLGYNEEEAAVLLRKAYKYAKLCRVPPATNNLEEFYSIIIPFIDYEKGNEPSVPFRQKFYKEKVVGFSGNKEI